LFNEELGAVLQIRKSDRTSVMQTLRDAGLVSYDDNATSTSSIT